MPLLTVAIVNETTLTAALFVIALLPVALLTVSPLSVALFKATIFIYKVLDSLQVE